jgi:hypothetical protein
LFWLLSVVVVSLYFTLTLFQPISPDD